ncbi:hypothetical protein NM688_g2681 [Phlebia brevispora]|uniref:Uncharacterized protein n=1 Tax=Phlebia brevispora TaxID=194682 RepID=A0ACC1T8B1_9APHY|nr:hypothetical protein NM688_g2681 [Phlebia brevispora]
MLFTSYSVLERHHAIPGNELNAISSPFPKAEKRRGTCLVSQTPARFRSRPSPRVRHAAGHLKGPSAPQVCVARSPPSVISQGRSVYTLFTLTPMIMANIYAPPFSFWSRAISTIFGRDHDANLALKVLGPSGDYTKFWQSVAIFSATLLTMAVAMLQISRVADSTLAMPFLLSALELASYGLVVNYTAYTICYYVRSTEHVDALRRASETTSRRLLSSALVLLPVIALWASLLITTAFIAAYMCSSSMCDGIDSFLARIAWIGKPLFIVSTAVTQLTHAFIIGWVYTHYRAGLLQSVDIRV